jgi:hypothetical protein
MKVLKVWFNQVTSVLRPDNTIGGVRFNDGDEPNEDTFKNLLESTTFSTESNDKAKVSSGAAIGNEQGLVVLANDTQAKSNTSQLSDRSLVTQPHQLPSLQAVLPVNISSTDGNSLTQPEKDALTASGFNSDADATINIGVSSAITTRNNFTVRFSNTVLRWLSTIVSKLTIKAGGTTGQVYGKLDNNDYSAGWVNSGYNSVSTSTNNIELGILTFAVNNGFSYTVGTPVRASNGNNFVQGEVSSYVNGALEINVNRINGSGTFDTWTIGLGSGNSDAAVSGSIVSSSSSNVGLINVQYKVQNGIVYLFGTITLDTSVVSNTFNVFTNLAVKSATLVGVTVCPSQIESATLNLEMNLYMSTLGVLSAKLIGDTANYDSNTYYFTMVYPSV